MVQVVWQELGLEKDDELYAEIDALRRTSGSDSEGGRGGAGGEGDKAAALLEPDEQKGAAREVACVAAVLTNEVNSFCQRMGHWPAPDASWNFNAFSTFTSSAARRHCG